jgi:hypothetical protein
MKIPCINPFQSTFSATAYSPAPVYFGRERGWCFTCNYPTVLKEKNRNRKSTTCAICWLKSVLHDENRREQENHNVGLRVLLINLIYVISYGLQYTTYVMNNMYTLLHVRMICVADCNHAKVRLMT